VSKVHRSKAHKNLGAARAESDSEMLSAAFVQTADFKNLAGGPYLRVTRHRDREDRRIVIARIGAS
jgi:hypothetical protein